MSASTSASTQQYLFSIMQPDGEPPAAPILKKIMADIAAVREEMQTAGAWVFTCGLHAASASTVVRYSDGESLLTDGPYVEGKEHIGGLVVVRARDLDAALVWAGKLARATTLPIEVRPIRHGGA
jgi:hypothetical protein